MSEERPRRSPLGIAREHRLHGRYEACSQVLQEVLGRDPMNPEAMLEGALLAMATLDFPTAERFLDACRLFDPRNAELLVQVAVCAFRQREPERAVQRLAEAAALAPGHLAARVALGQLLYAAGRPEEGARELQAAFALPAEPGAEEGERRSLARVTAGDWDGGWAEFALHWETRFAPAFRQPRWWRGEDRPDDELHVVGYGGLGDGIFFSRFLLRAARRVRHVHACVPPPLHRLLQGTGAITSFTPSIDAIPPGALACSLWHLPWLLASGDSDRYAPAPFLQVPPDAPELAPTRALRVGIAWAGNRRMGHDADRSPPSIATFRPLFDVAGIEWMGLHPEPEVMREGAPFGVQPLPLVRDLADTAGILRQLDLVITVDSVVANLAPALGVPTWIFPTTVPEPRWPTGHERSPWFPAVRPFRRRHLNDWEAAVNVAALALRERLARDADPELPE